MATYLKRTSKLFDISLSQTSAEMNLRDVICPVCRGILIEPVTLPCTHNLCLRCLKGTFEHNSLSCPLCRVRVGSWLRSATKSETLVNNELWDLIKSRFPKEIECKHNDDDDTTDSVYPPKIISAVGEIRREYEMQLQIAEEEIRRQREAEIMANEALIRKLQEQEQKKLAQYAQDQLLAKTIAKKQLLNKEKNVKFYNNCMSMKMPSDEVEILPLTNPMMIDKNNACSMNQRMSIRQSTDFELKNKQNEDCSSGKCLINKKGCCQGELPFHSVVTLKHQTMLIGQKNQSNYSEPSCSTSKIYGTRSEEELRVPSDVLSNNKKNLGIEICVTTVNKDDKRIGSAESAGSHDSINQEIHHFKPIKAMPRTPLRLSQDGRQIDPKLIRVVSITKRVSNVVPKAPSPSHFKRIVGCSWSAFREFLITGKTQQNLEFAYHSDWMPLNASNTFAQSYQASKLMKPESVRKIDLAQDMSFDNNKHYTKGINRIINGTKVSKKLVLDDEIDDKSSKNTWESQIKNGLLESDKKYKTANEPKEFSEDENYSLGLNSVLLKNELCENENGAAIENIAERIKRRKVSQYKKTNDIAERIEIPKKARSIHSGSKKEPADLSVTSKRKLSSKESTKLKRLRVKFNSETEIIDSQAIEENEMGDGKVTRKSTRSKRKKMNDSSRVIEDVNDNLDDIAIKEQERIERLLLQEKEDFELAQRLQAEFDGMECISGRTRRSKRALKTGEIEFGMDKMRINGRLLINNVSSAKTSSRGRRKQKRE